MYYQFTVMCDAIVFNSVKLKVILTYVDFCRKESRIYLFEMY